MNVRALLVLVSASVSLWGAPASGRYALILAEPAAASRSSTRAAMLAERANVRATQATVRAALAARQYTVTGSATLLMNAVFVSATPEQLPELQALPGV